jgi:hemoglobin
MDRIPTLSEWMRGHSAMEQLMKVFYEKVLQDELLQPLFKNMGPDHPRHVAQFVTEVFKGPALYTGERKGSHALMVAHHLNRHLTEVQRQRWVTLLLETADETGIPTDPEFRSALVAYLEWGSRIAVANSNTTENPIDDDAPMPAWGWGEPGGPYRKPDPGTDQ